MNPLERSTIYRTVRGRVREARHLDQPAHPIRWALQELAADLCLLARVIRGR